MPKISIILPIYNVEQYLEECLMSILHQSFFEFECICVIDGSTDRSEEILRKKTKGDTRFKILSQNNRGLSSARNVGIDKAKGEYIMFVDSDDFIDEDACEQLYSLVENEKVDILGSCFRTYPEGSVSKFSMRTGVLSTASDLLKSTLKPQSSDDLCFVWRYLIRRDFLNKNNIRFNPEIRYAEDMIFMMESFSYAKKIYLTDYAPYHYRTNNPHSIMHERKYNAYMENSLCMIYDIKKSIIQKNRWDEITPFSFDLAERTIKNYTRMLMENRKEKGETANVYIKEVLALPMMRNAFQVIGFRNIYSNGKEYFLYLCMKFQILPILKLYY